MTHRSFEFTHALCRSPAKSVTDGLRATDQGDPDPVAFGAEHGAYVSALREAGCDVTVLPADEAFPDSVFIEDPALVLNGVAIVLPITFIVLSNASFGWIKASQKDDKGGRYHNVDFTRVDQAAVAAAYGVKSWSVTDPATLETGFREAINHDGPTLVDVITQPLEQAAAPVRRWMG